MADGDGGIENAKGDRHNLCTPGSKKPRLSYAEHIVIIVGEDETQFTAHKHAICVRSEFFKAVCSDRWTQHGEKSQVVELLDEDPDIFDVYLYCLYHDATEVGDTKQHLPGEEYIPSQLREEYRLAKAYILADKLRDVKSANIIMESIILLHDFNCSVPSVDVASVVSNGTATGSPLRQIVIDYLTHVASLSSVQEICECETIPRSFICDMMLQKATLAAAHPFARVEQAFEANFITRQPRCVYYQHDDLQPTCGDDCERRGDISADREFTRNLGYALYKGTVK